MAHPRRSAQLSSRAGGTGFLMGLFFGDFIGWRRHGRACAGEPDGVTFAPAGACGAIASPRRACGRWGAPPIPSPASCSISARRMNGLFATTIRWESKRERRPSGLSGKPHRYGDRRARKRQRRRCSPMRNGLNLRAICDGGAQTGCRCGCSLIPVAASARHRHNLASPADL